MNRLPAIAILSVLLTSSVSDTKATGAHSTTDYPWVPAVYFSDGPNHCVNFFGQDYWIFVHSPDDENINRATFDLEVSMSPWAQPVIVPEPGVVVGLADVSTSTWHFDLAWSPRSLEHEPIVKVLFFELGGFGDQLPTNVTFERGSGEAVPGYGQWSLGCCASCPPCLVNLYADDPGYAVIGRSTEVPFEWRQIILQVAGGPILVSDTEGWVSAWTPGNWGGGYTCDQCFYTRYPGTIVVDVPDDVAVGATSAMTIFTSCGSRTFTLEAIEPVPVQTSTWGAVKALFE